jgi:hypothetical protein
MHITTVIDAGTKNRIQAILAASKGYESIDEFVQRAIINLIALEESESEQPIVVSKTEPAGVRQTRASRSVSSSRDLAPIQTRLRGKAEKAVLRTVYQIDASLLSVPADIPAKVSLPTLDPGSTTRPLWGQINRFAPAKVSLRILANILAKNKLEWVDLKVVTASIGEQAPLIKETLLNRDKTDSRKRGEGFSAAFPVEQRPSLQRFANQYVGYLAKESGEPQGLLADLSLVNIRKSPEGMVEIGLTEPGLQFSKLASPLIDVVLLQGKQTSSALSPEEAKFLFAHLEKYRPGELEFLKYVARRVGEGSTTPTALLTAVDDYFKQNPRGMTITDAVLGTMRTGAVSKLVELGIITITKDGAKSIYQLTQYSKDILGDKQ